jgi:DNA uptake protein ComE-like DNA-binding protein
MRRRKVCLIAAAVLATTLSGGCSSMERAFDDVMDRGDDDDRSRVDLNSAGRKRLASLPGISDDEADRIVAGRPYENRRDLVRKRVLSEDEFERIKDHVYVDREKN